MDAEFFLYAESRKDFLFNWHRFDNELKRIITHEKTINPISHSFSYRLLFN